MQELIVWFNIVVLGIKKFIGGLSNEKERSKRTGSVFRSTN